MARRGSSRRSSSSSRRTSSPSRRSSNSGRSPTTKKNPPAKKTPNYNPSKVNHNVSSPPKVDSNGSFTNGMLTGGILGYMFGGSNNSNNNKPIKKTYITNINVHDDVLNGCGTQLQQVLNCTNKNSDLNQCIDEIELFKICLQQNYKQNY